MLTLSYGFKKPQTNDRGPVVFPALEANWQQVNDHTHNGTNSAPINSADLEKTTQTLLAANWSLLSGGHYTQTATLPGGLQFDAVTIHFRNSAGDEVYPSVAKVSATQYSVGFDDNTETLTAIIN